MKLPVFLFLIAVNALGQQSSVSERCVKDLEAIPAFLLENDTGAKDHLAQFGQKHFDDAFAQAKDAATRVRGNASCAEVLNRYLKAWRKGHLAVESIVKPESAKSAEASQEPTTAAHKAFEPTLQVLSQATILLTLKSFEDYCREPLIALLKQDHFILASHPNWIVDVRGNGGGSDSSYTPLLPWLMPDETSDAGDLLLATPANIAGWERVCALYSPGDAECEKSLHEAVVRMRTATPGQYIAQDEKGAISFNRVKPLEPQRPSRVAILIDGGCGSSCEEFALAARQSFNVKLIGRHTYGSLDYSNVRPWDLPSGRLRLWYATSRSNRIPGLLVDVAGVPPDIYLPPTPGANAREEEVRRVRSWLEGGSLAPQP